MSETVLLDLRPHGRALVLPVLALLVVVGASAFVAARAAGPSAAPLRLAVVGAAALLLTRLSLLPWLRWRGSRFLLTTERLALREGALRRSGRDVPLGRIDDVAFSRSLRQRLVGSGDLWVTAGEGPPLVVHDLRRVEAVQRAVQQAVDRAVDGVRGAQ